MPERVTVAAETAVGVATDPAATHRRAVAIARDSYARIPEGEPVRLAKATSNLFRFREPTTAPGLDVSALGEVLEVDPMGRTAQVQGMTTYERLVEATLPFGLMPAVVPQLKTITLGGAVTGLGIESSSFRHGLPHESVREMEILTGDGEVVVAARDNAHRALFYGFPNSYGTLGYALRLTIELEPVRPYVWLRHLRFSDAGECAAVLAGICAAHSYDDAPVDFLDGTVFSRDEMYLTLGTFVDQVPYLSDYTGQEIFYRSIQRRAVDHLTVHDYLWRWDTDWFWCSRALGAQHPVVRRVWPRSARRSDVYRRLVALDKRAQLSARVDRWRGLPPHEDVIQDVEIPVDRLADFLDFFHRHVGISPIWLCPVQLRENGDPGDVPWPLYPLERDRLYVNVGFWSSVALPPGRLPDHHNRLIEREVAEAGGHKSLYSTSFYGEGEFWRRYNGPAYQKLKDTYDPDGRLLDLYAKCVVGR
jgi:FAD/FMN-containing dehydrogenase